MNILETIITPVGSYAPDFELPGTDDQVHHLGRYLLKYRVVGVIAMCNYCPYVGLYLDKLKKIQTEFADIGLTLMGINGSDANVDHRESFESMKAFAITHNLNFPYLWDPTQEVTRSFGATKTPTAFLIDKNGILCYKGQIDNALENSLAVKEDYLRKAIASIFNGKEICIPETEVIGTSLIWRN